MSYLEMFVVVLAIMLFATVALVHQRGVLSATDTLANATSTIQATQLAHEVLDEIDARLLRQGNNQFFIRLSNGYNFSNPNSNSSGYNGKTFTRDIPYFGGSFSVAMVAADCDQYGNTANSTNLYTRVDVTVTGPADLRHPVRYSRVFSSWK